MGRVSGKVALVTGGAMGMGKSHSELLAREGAHVFVTDRDAVAGEAVAKAIVAAGGKADFIQHDVTSEADWPMPSPPCAPKPGGWIFWSTTPAS